MASPQCGLRGDWTFLLLDCGVPAWPANIREPTYKLSPKENLFYLAFVLSPVLKISNMEGKTRTLIYPSYLDHKEQHLRMVRKKAWTRWNLSFMEGF